MYQRILVPLDGSELAECVLSHAQSFVMDRPVVEITLLHVVKIDIPWSEVDLSEFRGRVSAETNKYLAEMKSRLVSTGVKVKTKAVEANAPAETIAKYAEENNIDLIVMSTHGYTGFKKMMLGSVASGVLNQSSVPVLLIRPEACRL
jgi:nucleotide-binding universal stress UspA family protein